MDSWGGAGILPIFQSWALASTVTTRDNGLRPKNAVWCIVAPSICTGILWQLRLNTESNFFSRFFARHWSSEHIVTLWLSRVFRSFLIQADQLRWVGSFRMWPYRIKISPLRVYKTQYITYMGIKNMIKAFKKKSQWQWTVFFSSYSTDVVRGCVRE